MICNHSSEVLVPIAIVIIRASIPHNFTILTRPVYHANIARTRLQRWCQVCMILLQWWAGFRYGVLVPTMVAGSRYGVLCRTLNIHVRKLYIMKSPGFIIALIKMISLDLFKILYYTPAHTIHFVAFDNVFSLILIKLFKIGNME